MDAQALALIQNMASTTIAFASDVVDNLWALLLSLFVLASVAGYIFYRIGRVGR